NPARLQSQENLYNMSHQSITQINQSITSCQVQEQPMLSFSTSQANPKVNQSLTSPITHFTSITQLTSITHLSLCPYNPLSLFLFTIPKQQKISKQKSGRPSPSM
ncbi:hypothetical protein PJP14_29225, partial [Mycobacterium kansasii]